MTSPHPAPRTAIAPRPRRVGLGIAAVSLALLSATSWWQPVAWLFGSNQESAWVLVMHVFGGSACVAATIGTLRRRPWAWMGALGWGMFTGALVAGLGPVLDHPAEERSGLWVGAVTCLMIGGGFAWYLRRALPAPVALPVALPETPSTPRS